MYCLTTMLARYIIIAAMGICLGACALRGPARLTSRTSAPRPVKASEDNARILSRSTLGLIVTLEIEGTAAKLIDSRIATVSKAVRGGQEGEVVRIAGLRNGVRVASTAIADQRLNAHEQIGLVMLDKRTLIATLALPKRIDTLEVQVPGAPESQQFDVRDTFEKFCHEYAMEAFCLERPQ